MRALEHLEDYRIVHIVLPLADGEVLNRDCVARTPSPPRLEAVFLPGELPAEDIDLTQPCQISFEVDGQAFALRAVVEGFLKSADRLHLISVEASAPKQTRAFFRVDTDVNLRYFRFEKGKLCARGEELRVKANLSGGGIRFAVGNPPALQEQLHLEMFLGPDQEPVQVVGEVVRRFHLGRNRPAIALKFVRIADRDLDRIMAYCFSEQRRQLRSRVRILGYTR